MMLCHLLRCLLCLFLALPPPLYSSHLLITGQQRLAQLLLLLFHASSKPAPSDQSVVSASIYTLSASLHSTTTVTIR